MARDNGFVFSIRDNGIGIAEANIPRALEPFERLENMATKAQQGAGLGLSICKLLMQLHNGSIEIESHIDQSTNVALRFPAARTYAQITSAA